MESDVDYSEDSRSPSPPPCNILQPEKEFILKYETLPALWNPTCPQYTNRYKRNENLAKLLPILRKIKLNATVDDVKKKINTIRSNYRREVKKIIASERSGTGEIYCPKIWYYPYLHFLGNFELPEPTNQPIKKEPESAHQTMASVMIETEQINPPSIQQSREMTQEKRSFPSISAVKLSMPPKKKKRINHDELPDQQQVKSPRPITLEWSNTLDSLDPLQRLYAKKAINDILFEAELGNLNRHSVKINAQDPPPHVNRPDC